jgi:hypothetical protein
MCGPQNVKSFQPWFSTKYKLAIPELSNAVMEETAVYSKNLMTICGQSTGMLDATATQIYGTRPNGSRGARQQPAWCISSVLLSVTRNLTESSGKNLW